MRLVIGLGNVGEQYEGTRHNVGFSIIDILQKERDFPEFKTFGKGEISKKREEILLKPTTFMNLSGESVVEIMQFFKLDKDQILVIYDDLNIECGSYKLSYQSEHGGHNGVRNIINLIGRSDFLKLRIGIGHNRKEHLAHFVLGKLSDQEKKTIFVNKGKWCEIVDSFIEQKDAQWLMNQFNRKIKNTTFI